MIMKTWGGKRNHFFPPAEKFLITWKREKIPHRAFEEVISSSNHFVPGPTRGRGMCE